MRETLQRAPTATCDDGANNTSSSCTAWQVGYAVPLCSSQAIMARETSLSSNNMTGRGDAGEAAPALQDVRDGPPASVVLDVGLALAMNV
jgi:hypothetical protein